MKVTKTKGTVKQELVGIVISGMPSPPLTTVFSAYVWGPAPGISEDQPATRTS